MSEQSWYAVRTGIRAENRAAGSIEQIGIKTFCPMYERFVSHARRRVKVKRPLLSRYLFAQFDVGRDDWGKILHVDGVEYILSSSREDGGTGDLWSVPIAIPERQMARIMAWQEHPEIIAAAMVGDVMRIIGGPFVGHTTRLTDVWPDKFRARGNVKLFDRPTPVEFDLEQLERS